MDNAGVIGLDISKRGFQVHGPRRTALASRDSHETVSEKPGAVHLRTGSTSLPLTILLEHRPGDR